MIQCKICGEKIYPHNQAKIDEIQNINRGLRGNDRLPVPGGDYGDLIRYCYPFDNLVDGRTDRSHQRAAGRNVCLACYDTRVLFVGRGDVVKYHLTEGSI